MAKGYPKVLHWCLAPAIWPGARPCARCPPLSQVPTLELSVCLVQDICPSTRRLSLCQVPIIVPGACHYARCPPFARCLPMHHVSTLATGIHPCAKCPLRCQVHAPAPDALSCASCSPLFQVPAFVQVVNPFARYSPLRQAPTPRLGWQEIGSNKHWPRFSQGQWESSKFNNFALEKIGLFLILKHFTNVRVPPWAPRLSLPVP